MDEVRAEPYNLPESFEWCTCNIDDAKEAQEIYTLLSENYVEDDDSMFRFDYSVPFLKWALKPPGFLRQWHLGAQRGRPTNAEHASSKGHRADSWGLAPRGDALRAGGSSA